MSEYKTFLITDISGSAVTGLNSGFTTVYKSDGNSVSGATLTISEVGDGFYKVLMSLVPEGDITLQLKHSNPDYYITPDWHEWFNESSYTIDDVYGKLVVATSSTALPITPASRFSTVTINSKEGDDITEVIQVPSRYRPLTGWTNLSVKAYPSTRSTDSGVASISGTYSVAVLNDVDGIIQVDIGKDVTTSKVPNGVSSTIIYADVQGDDTTNKRRTLINLVATLNRDFNA